MNIFIDSGEYQVLVEKPIAIELMAIGRRKYLAIWLLVALFLRSKVIKRRREPSYGGVEIGMDLVTCAYGLELKGINNENEE